MWVCAPTFAFLGVAAEPVVVLVLGNQWHETAPVFQVLAISALAELLVASIHCLLISRGQAAQYFKLGLITSPIIVASLVIGLPFGIKAVAFSYTLAMLIILPWVLKFAFLGTKLTLQRLVLNLLWPVALCIAGVIFAMLAIRIIPPHNPLSELLVMLLGFAAAYLAAALIPRV